MLCLAADADEPEQLLFDLIGFAREEVHWQGNGQAGLTELSYSLIHVDSMQRPLEAITQCLERGQGVLYFFRPVVCPGD